MTDKPYPHLASPLEIGGVVVRNRLMQTAHARGYARDGLESQRDHDYLLERARGGAGLLVAGNRLVHPTSSLPRFALAYRREALQGDRALTSAIHEHGAAVFLQLNHFGSAAFDHPDDMRPLWAPSAVRSPASGQVPKAMEPEDLAAVVEAWGRCAELAREGGFDGVEVHVAHTYLLNQFLSPLFNRRGDEYGGSWENRLRLTLEVLAEVRLRVGRDFVVGVRLSLSDFAAGGLTFDDAERAAADLARGGGIDFLDVSGAGSHNFAMVIPPSDVSGGWLLDGVARVKRAVGSLPVFAVGGIDDPRQAEALIADGVADMVAMTRGQIADPELAAKVLAGREREVIRCIRCNQGCVGMTASRGLPILCTVNPATGRERVFGRGRIAPARIPGSRVVVGGGPAGMKAAATLAARGHRVTLLEREPQLGGQVRLILATPGRETFARLVDDLRVQLELSGVETVLATDADAEAVLALAPDGVVVATGAKPTRDGSSAAALQVATLPGVEQESVLTVWDVLAGRLPSGRVVLLDDDGSRAAAGTAEVMLDAGCDVEVVTRFNALFPALALTLELPFVYERLFRKGIRYRANAWARGIGARAVTVYDLYTGVETTLADVDAVVLATAPAADDSLYHELKGRVPLLSRAGDCVAPRRLDHAIFEGFAAGLELDGERPYFVDGVFERQAEPVAV